MDITGELISAIWHKLTQDEELKQLFKGTVRLYDTWAKQDSPMPYMVHRVQERPLPDGVIAEIDYYLDIWEYDREFDGTVYLGKQWLMQIKNQVVALLDGEVLVTSPSGAVARFRYFSGGAIPEETAGIHHFATQWRVRIDRTADILAKLKE